MRLLIVHKHIIARVAVVVCLLLVSVAYVRMSGGDGWPTAAAPARSVPVYSVDVPDKRIAISFDAAWGAQYTMEILDILDEYNVKSSFFLVGYWVDKYPDQVRAIIERGHEIGNHSANHPHMTELSAERMRKELKDMSDGVERVCGVRPTLFRPPYGDYNNTVVNVSREEGYIPVQWSVDSLDWKEFGKEEMIKQVVDNKYMGPGAIVLFHNNSKYITESLPAIIEALQDKGYEIVPVSELLLTGETYVDNAGVQRAK